MDARLGLKGWAQPCPIPTLEQLFQTFPQFEPYQLEVKSGSKGQAGAVLEAITDLEGRYQLQDKVVITSASRDLLRQARNSQCPLPTGLVEEYGMLDPIQSAQLYQCRFLALSWKLCTPARVARAQSHGLHVSAWTVNEPSLMLNLRDIGVD